MYSTFAMKLTLITYNDRWALKVHGEHLNELDSGEVSDGRHGGDILWFVWVVNRQSRSTELTGATPGIQEKQREKAVPAYRGEFEREIALAVPGLPLSILKKALSGLDFKHNTGDI
jgi:hypothetical protein